MNHPLTDSYLQSYYKYSDGPYDEDDMRDVADWQLEQVIEFLESENCSDYGGTLYYPTKEEDESIREALLRVMRPQEDDQ